MKMADKEKKWHYANPGGSTVGPLDIDELGGAVLDGRIEADTAIWTSDYGKNWRAASEVVELFPAFARAEKERVRVAASTEIHVVPPRTAFRNSVAVATSVLFRPFRFTTWISLAFCCLMASSRMLYGLGTPDISGSAPVQLGTAAASDFAVAWLLKGVKGLFEPHISASWLIAIVLYGLLTSYIAAKGRLVFVGKAYSPDETMAQLWRRGIGRTASLWRFYFTLDILLNIGFYALLYRFIVASGLAEGEATRAAFSAALSSGNAIWVFLAIALVLTVEFIRACSFHFVEPLVFMLGVPVSRAAKMAAAKLVENPLAFIAFFGIVALCRIVYATLAIAGLVLLPVKLAFPVVLILLLPFDYLVRVFGTHFLTIGNQQ